MSWYLEVLKKYAVFSGRARRKEYWMFALISFLIALALGIVEGISGMGTGSDTSILASLYALAVLVPSLAVGVRRLHDTGRSGWWMLLAPVPLAGIVLLVFLVLEGERGPNAYGPDPKAPSVVSAAVPVSPAGWSPDPTGRHELRYWDSAAWTSYVSDAGVSSIDPIES